MKIAGIQKNSFVDYPNKLSAVIFTLGCNMNCFYCHNRNIIKENNQDLIDPDYFLEFLKKRRKFIEGVVITGGEPTLQSDLRQYIKDIKDIGYSIKLDTNGTNPEIIEDMIKNELIDYIAMDIKAPIERYNEICGSGYPIKNILKSIDFLLNSKIEYEFRTTLIPQITINNLHEIIKLIKGAPKYVIQQYKIPEASDGFFDRRLNTKPIDNKQIIKYGEEVKKFFKEFEIRGIPRS